MIIREMEGSDRELLIDSVGALLRRTKAAIGTNEGSFLPTTAATQQVEQLERLKGVIPPYDDADRDVEIIEPLVGLARNSVVVRIWNLDAKVRGNEQQNKVPTRETDAIISRLHYILTEQLGDERDLEAILKRTKRNGESVEKDPNQLDIEDEAAAGVGA